MDKFEHLHLKFSGELNAIETLYTQAIAGLNDIVLSDKDKWYSHVLSMPKHLQVVYTVGIYNWKILNDGHRDYFYSGLGIFAELTISNLKLTEAQDAAILLDFALKQVNYDKLSATEFRNRIFNQTVTRIVDDDRELESMLEIIDDKYHALGDEYMYDILGKYASQFL